MRAPDPPDFDLYETLEVSPRASAEMIDAAWKVMLRRHHPDTGGRSSGEAAAKRINVAHDWLSDPGLRARYDATRAVGSPPQPRAPSFQPPTFRTTAPTPTRTGARPQARGSASGPATPAATPTTPRSSAANAAPRAATAPRPAAPRAEPPADTPRPRRARQRRGIPRATGFVVAILIGVLAGLVYLWPTVFEPRAGASPSPSVTRTSPPARSSPRATRTATGWHAPAARAQLTVWPAS